MKGFDPEEIAETIRTAMEAIPKDFGVDFGEAVDDLFSGGDSGPERVEHTFDVGSGAELSIGNVSGDIHVRGGDVTTITVRAHKHGSRRRMENTRIDVVQNGNRVGLKTRGIVSGRFGIRGNVCSVEYDVVVPRQCAVDIDGVSGDVSLKGTALGADIKTVSGDVRIEELSGECSVITVSGDINAARIENELKLRTTSGDTTIINSRLHRFHAGTVSGDLTIETPLWPGEYYFAKTVSGDLHLGVPHGTGVTVQMKTVSGDVDVDQRLPAEIIKSGRRTWQGRINNGGANLEMNSVSGDLRITVASGLAAAPPPPAAAPEDFPPGKEGRGEDTVPPVSPTPPTPPISSSEAAAPAPPPAPPASEEPKQTTLILQALARGEISVEDALSRLETLGGR